MGALLSGIGQASTILLLLLANWIAFHSSSAAALTVRQQPTVATTANDTTAANDTSDPNLIDFPPGLYLGWGIDVTQLGIVDGSNVRCSSWPRHASLLTCYR